MQGVKMRAKYIYMFCLILFLSALNEGFSQPDYTESKSISILVTGNNSRDLNVPISYANEAIVKGYKVNLYFKGKAVKALDIYYKEHCNSPKRKIRCWFKKEKTIQEKLLDLKDLGVVFFADNNSLLKHKVHNSNLIFSDINVCKLNNINQIFVNE